QQREYLARELVASKEDRGRRILGAVQATPVGQGYEFLFGVREGLTATEEYRLAAECFDRVLDLRLNGRVLDGRYAWQERDGVLWIQLIDGLPSMGRGRPGVEDARGIRGHPTRPRLKYFVASPLGGL